MTPAPKLVALHTAPPAFSTAQAEAFARTMFGVDGTAHPLYGERDQNFRIRTTTGPGIILKILGADEAPAAVDFQTCALEHIAAMDPTLPVPRLARPLGGAAYGFVQGHLIRALHFQPGRVMEGVSASPALLRDTGATLARLNAALANFFHPGAGQQIVWDLRRIVEMRPFAALIEPAADRALIESVLDRFIAFLPALGRLRHQIVHNDLHPGNLLTDDEAGRITGLLDFGDMIHGPLVLDLAVTAAETTGAPADVVAYAAQVVAGYNGVVPLLPEEFGALFECIIARHALSATIMAWRRHNDPDGAAKLGALAAQGVPAIAAYLAEGKTRVVERFRAACAAPAHTAERLLERRFAVLGKGLELSYQPPVQVVRGEGVHLYGPGGERYLDAYNNVPSVGHGNARVARAIADQMATLCTNTRYLHHTLIAYAERLTATMPAGLERCLFVNSGSEANDAAYRIAKLLTGRAGAIVMEHAYHGVTDVVAALSPYYGPLAQPQADWIATLPLPHPGDDFAAQARAAVAALQAKGHGVAMLLIDSAFTSNGIPDLPAGYFAAIAAEVRTAGGLVVGDEVQSGFGRLGDAFWGFAVHGVVPDMVTLGKPMANGHPCGAVVTRADILDAFAGRVDFFSTFGGNQVAAAAALATLDELQERGLQANARATGEALRAAIAGLGHPSLTRISGRGLMVGMEVAEGATRAKQIANAMRARGVLIGTESAAGNVLKIRPPLPFGPADAATLVEALEAALGTAHDS